MEAQEIHLMLEWVKTLGSIFLSWPTAVIIGILYFRKPIIQLLDRFSMAKNSEAEIGPLKIKLGDLARQGEEAVNEISKISILMAESRLLELEITEKTFGPIFTSEQHEKMKKHIQDFQKILQKGLKG